MSPRIITLSYAHNVKCPRKKLIKNDVANTKLHNAHARIVHSLRGSDCRFGEMAKLLRYLTSLLLVLAITPAFSLYFHIGETEKKCFIEEIPDETMVIGEYIEF